MKKKLIKQLFALVAVFLMASSLITPNASAASKFPNVEADAAILIEADTGQILYEKNSGAVLGIASMTKMMTEYLILEAIHEEKLSWDDQVGVSKYAADISQDYSLSNVPLLTTEKYTIKELYEAMAIYSANGASIALAEALAGSEAEFIKLMNKKAEELNLGEAKFVNSTGLSNSLLKGQHPKGTKADDENLLSARAVSALAFHILHDYPEVLETAKTPEKIFRPGQQGETTMDNWNKMLPSFPTYGYEGLDGLKTGHTDFAGYCFTGTAERNGVRYITVVMNAKNNGKSFEGARFTETKKLLDYAFDNYELKQVTPEGKVVKNHESLPVVKGKNKELKVVTKESVNVLTKKGEEGKISLQFDVNPKVVDEKDRIVAPIKEGQVVGYVSAKNKNLDDLGYAVNDGTNKVPVVADTTIEKANWFILALRSVGDFFVGVWSDAANNIKSWF
ncbi:D-alanyl-D-alanine carboxypeptidase [Priestia aryabhattai]|uniref:serine hydrolase n=1 Tax=Priestia TaxID=2800373 RepID=UPI000BA00EAC|nr:serine hydrolase [Priestia flexa]MDT2044732.1 serine hydrolase [Priestia flexa]OZT10651.1 D-alanyl-D-alanine carboxypeptidase [Priestia aryabhattai]USY55178.1 D-alanyl-D-alanine carboxypeptidase [Bacillus sp. 1780r2a1]